MKKNIVLIIPLLLIYGCGTTSNINYVEPKVISPQTNITLAATKDTIWPKLVKNLSSNFFVINNLEKDSGLINVSFSSSTPEDYMTCGKSTRYFKNLRGENTYVYDPIETTSYSTTSGNFAYNVRRTSNLDGRANIYVSDTGPETDVSVNVIYNANVTVNAYDFITGNFLQRETYNFTPSSKSPYMNGEVTCVTNGSIERKLLELVN